MIGYLVNRETDRIKFFGEEKDCPEHNKEKYKFVYYKDIPIGEQYRWRNKKYEDSNFILKPDSEFNRQREN